MDELDDRIDEIRSNIEIFAPEDRRVDREKFYHRLSNLPKDKVFNILLTIFNCQIASDLKPHLKDIRKQRKIDEWDRRIKQWDTEEKRQHEKARKCYEYIQRQLSRGKVPKVSPPDSMLLVPQRPKHRPIDISLLNLWDLYVVLKESRLFPVYENLKLILRSFLNVFMEVNSIKRELSRIRNDPKYRNYVRDYIEFT